MKLRDRLLLFSVAQLLVFGALFAVGYIGFRTTVLPMLGDHLRTKADTGIAALAAQLDLALGADDHVLIHNAADVLTRDPDLLYIEVRDAKGAQVFRYGATAATDPFTAAQKVVYKDRDAVHVWMEVKLESLKLGAVAVAYSTARIEQLRLWSTGLMAVVFAIWLAALVYSVVFARSFASPIRAMMEFSRKVANGNFSDQLAVDAVGELRELTTHLNSMTAELLSREDQRQAAAARAAALQRELVAVSRMAGMAEVATGVLHNVGNVLNSLNVSIAVVGDELRNSKVSALSKAVGLYSAHPEGLAGFLTTAKGPMLPQLLASISELLVDENTHARSELASVLRNVEHIKAIVATQQTYAQVSGLRESLRLAEVVDDALKIDASSLSESGIELVKDYEAGLPEIISDRHRVLQIIINLLSNARHAVQAHPGAKRLTVRLARDGGGVSVLVTDNGVGISAEHLARVFEHGFTTKLTGHGFGLHASANAAHELGGSLIAASDGVGCGAAFTLALPSELPARNHVRN